MTFIAEFTIETPVLEETLAEVPDMVLQTETLDMRSDRPTKTLVWAWGGDFDAFERNLAADPAIEGYEHLSKVDGQRLYRFVLTREAEDTITYPVLVEHDAAILNTRGTYEGMEIRARFPGRDALTAYHEACRERDIPFHLHSLYREEDVAGDGGRTSPYGLTDPQREALLAALERGYFAVPRETTLEVVADDLAISTQAVSTRLRRGQRNLLENTLGY